LGFLFFCFQTVLGKKVMSRNLSVVPTAYDAEKIELCSFFDAVHGFLNCSDTPRDYLERCVEIVAVRELNIRAFVATDIEAARLSADQSIS